MRLVRKWHLAYSGNKYGIFTQRDIKFSETKLTETKHNEIKRLYFAVLNFAEIEFVELWHRHLTW